MSSRDENQKKGLSTVEIVLIVVGIILVIMFIIVPAVGHFLEHHNRKGRPRSYRKDWSDVGQRI